MGQPLNDEALDILFRQARTHRAWLPKPVPDDLLRKLYDVMKWAPTSADCSPIRILFLRTPEAKERLKPALGPRNVEKTMTAPVTAIVAYDLRFYEKMPPENRLRDVFASAPPEAQAITAFRNGSIQGGYFILAARRQTDDRLLQKFVARRGCLLQPKSGKPVPGAAGGFQTHSFPRFGRARSARPPNCPA